MSKLLKTKQKEEKAHSENRLHLMCSCICMKNVLTSWYSHPTKLHLYFTINCFTSPRKKFQTEEQHSHSHQLNFKLDWSRIKLWLAQVVLAFLKKEKKKKTHVNIIYKKRGFDRYGTLKAWSGADPAAQRALHQEVFVSWVELRCPRRLEVWLQKPLPQRGHWTTRENTDSPRPHFDKLSVLFSELQTRPYLQVNWWVWCNNPQAGAPPHQGPGLVQWWSPSGLHPLWG